MSFVEYLGRDKPVNGLLPRVSVIVPTFQHARFIAECLDAIMLQETTFPIEILVGEDQSTDGTREICMAYAEKHPDKIRLFLNNRNDVIFIDGRPTGRANFLNLFSESRGEFIALCEGDDYWTDKTKLEQQVEIFRNIPDCSLVFHNARIIGEERYKNDFCSDLKEGFFDLSNVIGKPWFVPAQSVMFRKEFLELGEWARHVYNCDYAIQLMLATRFPFYYIDKVMSVYRIHEGGSGRGRKIFYHSVKVIETLTIFNSISGFKYDEMVKKRLEDIRASMLTNGRRTLMNTIIADMSWWEKALTFRFYYYAASAFLVRLKKKSGWS